MPIQDNCNLIKKKKKKKSLQKATANITLTGGKFEAFPLRSGIMEECLLSPCLFNTCWKVLATPIIDEKQYTDWEEIKLFLFVWHNGLYIKSQTNQTKNYWN